MNNAATTQPAISPLAIPGLEHRLGVENARCKGATYAKICGSTRVDIQAQLAAAKSGAATWTDTRGSVWGAGGARVDGTPSLPGAWFGGAGF